MGGTEAQHDTSSMDRALRQAEAAVRSGQTPFGAVVVDRQGSLIGEGHNRARAERDRAAHGEVVAIRDAWRRLGERRMLAGATLYTTCDPCLLCSVVITQIGFRRVVFAARGADVPTYKPLLGANLVEAAAWVNAQADWTPLEVVADFMRERAVSILATFPWTWTQTKAAFAHSNREEDACPPPRPSSCS